MAGLFEDDANVWSQPKPKKAPAKKKKAPQHPKGMGARMLDKVDARADLVSAAGGNQIVDFAKVDVSPLRKKKKAPKVDDGKLSPAIDYVKD